MISVLAFSSLNKSGGHDIAEKALKLTIKESSTPYDSAQWLVVYLEVEDK